MSLFRWVGWRAPMAKKGKRRCAACGEMVWDEKARVCATCLADLPEEK